ncbi:MAG: hypothetical protein AAB217_12210 [Chloroflexota bacterium]
MTTQTSSQNDNATLLRRALQGNTVFSGVSGLALAFAARPLASLMGLPSPLILTVIGLGVLGYAAIVFRISTRPSISRGEAIFTVIADSSWVVGSLVLLLTGWVAFTLAGKWLIAVAADIVAVFALLQFVGLRRLGNS